MSYFALQLNLCLNMENRWFITAISLSLCAGAYGPFVAVFGCIICGLWLSISRSLRTLTAVPLQTFTLLITKTTVNGESARLQPTQNLNSRKTRREPRARVPSALHARSVQLHVLNYFDATSCLGMTLLFMTKMARDNFLLIDVRFLQTLKCKLNDIEQIFKWTTLLLQYVYAVMYDLKYVLC
jgi:hypothetical protein